MKVNRTAKCLCEQTTITLEGEPELVAVCNCLLCQRQFGSAFGWVAYFKENAVISKSDYTGTYKRSTDSSNETSYSFCKACGSTLWWNATYLPNLIGTAAGNFEGHDFPPPSISVWERTKQSWVKLPFFVLPFTKQLPSVLSRVILNLKLPKLVSFLMSILYKSRVSHINTKETDKCALTDQELLRKYAHISN